MSSSVRIVGGAFISGFSIKPAQVALPQVVEQVVCHVTVARCSVVNEQCAISRRVCQLVQKSVDLPAIVAERELESIMFEEGKSDTEERSA
jgi:hypothetical protein